MFMTDVSREVLNVVAKQLDRQNKKGYEEYNATIDQAKDEDYDWNVEALAECIDALQYQVKENMKLRKELKLLRLNEKLISMVARKRETE